MSAMLLHGSRLRLYAVNGEMNVVDVLIDHNEDPAVISDLPSQSL